jgi:hypothetical protein
MPTTAPLVLDSSVSYLEIMAPSGRTDVCQLEFPSIWANLCIVSLKMSINYFVIVSVVLQSRSVTAESLGFT